MGANAAAFPGNPGRVMASIDHDGHEERLIIADVSTDQAWLSMPASDALPLARWR